MAILNETKEELTRQFGAPAKSHILVGGDELFKVDEALRYTLGRFEVTVGFFDGRARYACFSKDPMDEPSFEDRDVEVSLALVAPGSQWTLLERESGLHEGEADSWVIDEYKTTVKDVSGNDMVIMASHRTIKPYFLAYTPMQSKSRADDMGAAGRLDGLLSDMNTAATVEARLEAMIAVINELAREYKIIRAEGRGGEEGGQGIIH